MKRITKMSLFAIFVLVCLAAYSLYLEETASFKPYLQQSEALKQLLKSHPDFPDTPGETITRELPTGGPVGSKAKVQFTTKVDTTVDNTCIVTFIKDWGISVNGKYAKSFWKYEVTKDSETKLIDSEDNDNLINTME